jgi:pimeloyl-ACP methyl ester carboxylesterase
MSATNVVLVHGAFADGSSWHKVILRLQAQGYHATAVQPPLTSLAEDVAITRHVLGMQEGNTILVGHGYGGVVITEAGNEMNVAGLVYVAAFAPDEGESIADLLGLYPPTPGFERLHTDDLGFTWIETDAFPELFAADLDPVEARVMAAVQQPWKVSGNRITQAAWRYKPSSYQVSENDQMIHPALQVFLAERMGATTISLPASHASVVSRPVEIAQLIDQAAKASLQSRNSIPLPHMKES